MYYLTYWEHLAGIFAARPLFQTPFFLDTELPLFVFLSSVWPYGHIALGIVLSVYWFIIASAGVPYEKHVGGGHDSDATISGFMGASLGLAIFLTFGTLGGSAYEKYVAAEKTYAAAVPRVLPPKPRPDQLWIKVEQRQVAPVMAVYDAAQYVRLMRAGIEVTSVLLGVFVFVFLLSLRYFFFGLAYRRALSKPHLPTEIVDRAVSGAPIDHRALANAMTASTTPVVKDSLADKVERERLATLAERLKGDASALNDKLSKEAEIARLVVSHARKREELADMEQKLRDMGVQKHG